HLVLVDGAGKSLIAEIVDPRRVAESWKDRTTEARKAFDARHTASGSFQTAGETVTVTGVGFFDLLHGQSGAAPNGIELHAASALSRAAPWTSRSRRMARAAKSGLASRKPRSFWSSLPCLASTLAGIAAMPTSWNSAAMPRSWRRRFDNPRRAPNVTASTAT